MAAGIDKDVALKERAGSKLLNQYSNYYELQTLCDLLNTDFENVLKTDDSFCTKVLLSNLQKSIFEARFYELKHGNRK